MAEAQPSFDAAQYKHAQREQWNKDGAAWRRWNPTLDRWYGDATGQMLDLARFNPASACWTSPPVRANRRSAPPSGWAPAAMCWLGLMYMPHPVAALRAWRRVLRPGGRVAVMVFSTPDRNDWGALPAAIIRRRAQLAPPLPGQPGPFSLGAPGVLEGLLRQAGFADPEVHAVPVPLRMPSAAAYVQVAREAFGGFNAMMAHLSSQERASVWNEVEESMRQFESPAGFEVPGECLLGAATK